MALRHPKCYQALKDLHFGTALVHSTKIKEFTICTKPSIIRACLSANFFDFRVSELALLGSELGFQNSELAQILEFEISFSIHTLKLPSSQKKL